MNDLPSVSVPAKCTSLCVSIVAIVLVALILMFAPAAAQKSNEPAQDNATEIDPPSTPAPIPASQLSTRSEEAAAQLRQMRDRPVHDEQIDKIEEELPAVLAKLQKLMELTDASLVKSVSSRSLEDLDRRWQRSSHLIGGWRSRIARRAQSVDRDMESLQDLRELWEVTREYAVAAETQNAVLTAINSTLDQVRREETRFGEHRARLLNIGLQIAQAEDLIANAFDQLEAAKKELRVRLYAFDTPPLWVSLANPPPRADHVAQIRSVSSDTKSALKSFFVDYRNWLIVHALAFILLYVLMRSLNKRVKHLNLDHPDLEDSTNIVSRPFSSALLLALAGVLFFYQNPPRIVDELTTILCFIPLYRILPRKVFARLGRLLIWLVCLHIFDRFTDLLPYLSLLKRLMLLLLNVVTFAVVIRAIRDDATGHIGGTRHLRAIERVAASLLVVAFVSNVLGDLSLADMIVSAVISSAYSALVFYAVYLVIEAVLKIGVDTRVARSMRMVRRHGELVTRRIMAVLRFGFKVLWLGASLHWLQLLPLVIETLGRILRAQASFGDISISLGGVFAFAVTVWAAFLISRILRFILEEDVYPRMTLPRGVPNAITTGVHYTILLLAFILAIAATGADLGKFAILAGAFGVGIGFGLQNVVNNFISGLILIIERPVMPGDTIEFGDVRRQDRRRQTNRAACEYDPDLVGRGSDRPQRKFDLQRSDKLDVVRQAAPFGRTGGRGLRVARQTGYGNSLQRGGPAPGCNGQPYAARAVYGFRRQFSRLRAAVLDGQLRTIPTDQKRPHCRHRSCVERGGDRDSVSAARPPHQVGRRERGADPARRTPEGPETAAHHAGSRTAARPQKESGADKAGQFHRTGGRRRRRRRRRLTERATAARQNGVLYG